MRLRTLFALTGPVLLVMSGCTSDLPAPHDFEIVEPPPPPNELQLDCDAIPLTANSANFDFMPVVMGLLDGVTYEYTAMNLPEGLDIDPRSGQITGTVDADSGDYTFDVLVEDVNDRVNYSATTTCSLRVNPRISAPLAIDADPYCLNPGDDLRDLVIAGTGDGTPIACDWPGGNGNGRLPNGVEVDPDACVATGSIAEDRYGTWVFAMRGLQSGADVYVPYCITNDEAQGYEILGSHSGGSDELDPITRRYDPGMAFTVGADMDPRYEILSPGTCGASCFYKYSFLRTNAPLDGFTLEPDGLLQNAMMETVGFFHELRLDGTPVPEDFRIRPWVLSVAVSYCITDDENACKDVAAEGDGAFELSVIMVPDAG